MNTTDIRELDVAELDQVSGGNTIEIRLPGQVTVQLNTKEGVFCVWLAGKPYATEMGKV